MIVSGSGPTVPVADALAASARAQERAGVEVRPLSELADLVAACALFDRIWQPTKADVPATVEQLRALSHAGNYVAGAFDGGSLIGACFGFFADPPGVVLHSHVAGVEPGIRSRGVGFALKVHQRAWALDRGLTRITWTFDPLIRRNAYFNLAKLGATPQAYLVDFYGEVADAINRGQGSDRVLLSWDLTSPAVARACAGEPVWADPARVAEAPSVLSESATGEPIEAVASGPVRLVQTPTDIVSLRQRDPDAAWRWRVSVRAALGAAMDSGGAVHGLTPEGAYVVEVAPS